MRFSVGCRLSYRVTGNETGFMLNIQPARLERQIVLEERLSLTPELPVESYVMPESGNRYLRFAAPTGELEVDYRAEVELDPLRVDPAEIPEIPRGKLPFETLPHLLPSRYCQSDRLERAAAADFGGLPPGHLRVTGICNWINEQVQYLRGTSDVHTSACDTLVDRAGVCRDFAHLGIALCRAMGIPARYASAYAWRLQPPDFHGVFEAHLGGRWWWFDATRQAPIDGLVRIGVGRDASDVAFATISGEAQPLGMSVEIERIAENGPAEPTVAAISTTAM
jgi:transglutaminase-like putative cysteine protease